LYYVDANSSQWVAATSDPVNIGVVASQAERDAQYPTPGQGMRVYRTDLGVTQTYYGLFNASTNPGGMDPAGWYNQEKSAGLVPMRPTTVTIAGGTGAANGIGQVSFTNASNIDLDGVITGEYSNYRMIIDATYSANSNLFWWPRKSGVSDRPVNYSTQFLRVAGATINSGQSTGIDYGQLAQNASGVRNVCAVDLIGFGSLSFQRNTFSNSIGAAYNISIITTIMTATAPTTGITLNLSGGTFTGTVTVYGYND
jgi:hypothetical protein